LANKHDEPSTKSHKSPPLCKPGQNRRAKSIKTIVFVDMGRFMQISSKNNMIFRVGGGAFRLDRTSLAKLSELKVIISNI